jgi:hypothetical protein
MTQMTYRLTTFDLTGRQTATIGSFGNVASARQAMLDHSNTADLPDVANHFSGLTADLVEGWFIGSTEYNIER